MIPEVVLLLILLLGGLVALQLFSRAPAGEGANEQAQVLTIDRVSLQAPAEIVVEVSNNGPGPVTVAQVMIDDSYWGFTISPGPTIRRLGRATIRLPYLWLRSEPRIITLVSSSGETFDGLVGETGIASPPDMLMVGRYALLGIYGGAVPLGLGMIWTSILYPLAGRRRLAALGLGAGLALALLGATISQAAPLLSVALGATSAALLILSVGLLTFLALTAASLAGGRPGPSATSRALVGVGLPNLAKGLAIGAAFALGQASFGVALTISFAIHTIAEGARIAAPLAADHPPWWRLGLLAALVSLPTAVGVCAGDLAGSTLIAACFLAVGGGVCARVAAEALRAALRHGGRAAPLLLAALGGVAAGIALLYATALMMAS